MISNFFVFLMTLPKALFHSSFFIIQQFPYEGSVQNNSLFQAVLNFGLCLLPFSFMQSSSEYKTKQLVFKDKIIENISNASLESKSFFFLVIT